MNIGDRIPYTRDTYLVGYVVKYFPREGPPRYQDANLSARRQVFTRAEAESVACAYPFGWNPNCGYKIFRVVRRPKRRRVVGYVVKMFYSGGRVKYRNTPCGDVRTVMPRAEAEALAAVRPFGAVPGVGRKIFRVVRRPVLWDVWCTPTRDNRLGSAQWLNLTGGPKAGALTEAAYAHSRYWTYEARRRPRTAGAK